MCIHNIYSIQFDLKNVFCVDFQEATINSLVTIEVLMWFYIGECIGKRHLIGYDIKL